MTLYITWFLKCPFLIEALFSWTWGNKWSRVLNCQDPKFIGVHKSPWQFYCSILKHYICHFYFFAFFMTAAVAHVLFLGTIVKILIFILGYLFRVFTWQCCHSKASAPVSRGESLWLFLVPRQLKTIPECKYNLYLEAGNFLPQDKQLPRGRNLSCVHEQGLRVVSSWFQANQVVVHDFKSALCARKCGTKTPFSHLNFL